MLSREDFTAERIEKLITDAKNQPLFEALSHEERTRSHSEFLARLPKGRDLWVFGYGSLIWNPAFYHEEQIRAKLHGFHRSFCLHLDIGRGSADHPGLMLALDQGGSCHGVAFRIGTKQIRAETEILWNREMITGAYRPHLGYIQTEKGASRCLVFVINRRHSRYTGKLSMARQATLINNGVGDMGTCREYLNNTVEHLKELNISDSYLNNLAALLNHRQ